MRFSVVFLALVALGAAIPQTPKLQAADQDLLKKQQDVILLLENIVGPIQDHQLLNLGQHYDIEANLNAYVHPSVVKYVVGIVSTSNAQPKHTPFSVSVSQLRKEVALLTRILLGAKDYPTFLKTAAWIRVHCNEYQFVKAFIAAVLQRPDTQGIILPAPYEVFPHLFFDARIIQEVQDIKSQGTGVSGKVVHIPVNYTAHLPHDENTIAYFTQDIGLSAYYTYVQLAGYLHEENYVHGVEGEHESLGTDTLVKTGRGSIYYFIHQQLLARYNLERLSNGLGPIETLPLSGEIHIPYKPFHRHINGLEFPSRPESIVLDHQHYSQHHELVHLVHELEHRIINAIDAGTVLCPQGTFLSILSPYGLNILGNLIENTGRSINPRYYGSLAAVLRQLLGDSAHVSNIWEYTPSVLELAETAVHDPAFYQLYKRILHLFEHYQEGLPHYQYNDILVPGVVVQKVSVTPLVTFFDDYIVDLDNVVPEPVEGHHDYVAVKAQVKRLDHQPYELNIVVQSDKVVPNAVVRVFVGPKYNHEGQHIDINTDRLAFVELDQFLHPLSVGQNVIVRSSQHHVGQGYDWPSIHAIKDGIDAAVHSQNPFYITEPQQIFGFPARLGLPKGTQSGLPLQILVVVSTPEHTVDNYHGVIPEHFQNYDENSFHIVEEDEYLPEIEQVTPVHAVNSCHHAVTVVPRFHEQMSVPSALWHYGYLYKHWAGHQSFPHWQQHHYFQGEGEGHHQVHLGHLWQGLHYNQAPILGTKYGGQVIPGVVPQVVGHQQHTIIPGQHQVIGHEPVVGGHVVDPVQHTTGQVPVTAHVGGVHHVPGVGVHHQVGQHQVPVYIPGVGVTGGISGHHGVGVDRTVGGVHQLVHAHGNGLYPVHQESVQSWQVSDELVHKHYENLPIEQIIGGAISLDGKSLGWPLDRPLDASVLYVPNIHVVDVVVHHVDTPVNHVTGQHHYAQ